MSLTPGTCLGPYEVTALIGAGGMGEVYRARDTRLDRDVAIKVSDAEFSERFSREARSIAALNHSNVCHLYDVGPNYLVLEYVEGENLRGPLSWDEALPIVRQLIDGIDAAHEKNIIHRDLKTANIRITPEGVVKILDFGLAKAAAAESNSDPANSPTFTMGVTQAGLILGTAAYMAPEQAKGKSADRRSDIWSFGAVVYELLTGRAPFEGDSTVEILGAVINQEPDWSRVPPRAQRLLRWCLEKDRRKRLAAICDARMLLEDSAAPAVVGETKRTTIWWSALAAALALLAAVSGYGWWKATRPVARPLTRLSVDLGPDATRGPAVTAIISPDGARIAYSGRSDQGTIQLFTRRLDQTVATAVTGSNSTYLAPFFSPDGEWVGLFNDIDVKKVAMQGGSSVTIGAIPPGSYGASWGDDGNIIIGTLRGLMRLPSSGGIAQPLNEKAEEQIFPHVLPGSRAVLFNSPGATALDFDGYDIGVVAVESGETKTLLRGGYWPRYLATSGDTGHLVYMSQGTLFGVAFDPRSLEIHGAPVPLLEDVAASNDAILGGGQFASSNTGTFVYLSGRAENPPHPIQWLDAMGKSTALVSQTGAYGTPRLSPDGKRLAYTATGGKGADVWVYDFERDTPTQLTFTGPGDRELAWAADSKHLVFGDGSALWWVRADGSGQPIQLVGKMANPRPGSFAPDGRLAFSPVPGLPDVWTLPIDLSDPERPKPGKAEPFLTEPSVVEVDPVFSPDGRFLAYASSESGTEEVFVRPFPGPGGKWKISTAGGKFPAFAKATRELYFLGGNDRIMVVNYSIVGDSFSAGKPRVWSPVQIRRTGVIQSFDVSADGARAVIFPSAAPQEGQGSLHATFLLNFFDEVRRRIP
jgi:WD40 repeat protein/predicted Ser/Thr protein kinase